MLHPESKLATDRCLNVAVRALVTSAYFEENNGKPVRLRSLVKGLLEDTGVHFILLTHHLLDAFCSEYFTFAGNELEAIIEKIGTELLPSYEYSRNVDLQLLVIKFLQATVHQWGRDEAIELPYADKARKLAAWFAEQLLARNLPVWQVRTACIDMLKAFIVSKHLTAFGQGSEPLATWDGQELQPDEVLIRVLDDVDFRVRFRLAPVIGRICSRIHEDGRQAFSVWTSILKMKSFDLADMQFESNITTLLTYSNVMVASDFFRSNAYHPIITLAALDGSRTMSRYIRSALSATAGRLGLDSLADLYSFLAPYTMAEQLYNGQERLLIPDPTAFGFVNKQSLYAARFNETAPMILAGPRPEFFQDMCAYAGLEEKQATLLCFPTYVAYKFTAGEPGSEVFKLAEQEIAFKAVDIAPEIGQPAPDLLRSIRDLVIWRLFTFIWEAEYSRDSLVSIVTTCWTHQPLATAALQEMLSQVSEPFRPNVLSPPDVRLSSVLGSLKRSHPAIAGGLEDEAIVYSVLQRILCSVARPPFVSQQMRLLYNTAICMACARSVVMRSSPILELLCTRLSVLLAQEDLFQLGGSLFLWTVRQLVLLRRRDKSELQTEFHSILEAAEAAHRLAEEAANSSLTTYANASQFLKDLETCIFENGSETELKTLSSFKSLRLLWPRSTGIESTAPSLLDFEQALKAAKGQQGIVNVIQAMAKINFTSMSHKHQDKLAQILWLALSQCDATAVRKTNRPSFNEAFARLLQATCGRVAPPAIETMVNYTNFTETSETSAKLQIIAHLAGLLDSPDLEESNAAFEALVTIASTRSIDWLSLRDQRLEMLARPQLHRQSIQTQDRDPEVSPDLRDLVQDSYWLELAQSQTAWQRGITAFIARALGSNDSFYRPLGPLLVGNATLGRKCLPGLIEAILLVDKAENTRQIISTYLEKILDSASPSSADVVDLVIHLRTRLPPEGYAGLQSASLSDSWLSIPYSKLARSALAAGQPYAALLCVELARDQGNDLSSVPKEVLYKIYNDIKEPDNFYSIASADLPSGLIRRLHHEGRWLEALSWHGAELEASSARSPATAALENIIQTLSQGDLSRTAMALLQTRGATYTLPEGVLSSLAWKTQSWDIPILQKPAPGSSSAIFDSLRTAGKAHSMSHQDPASNANMGRQLAELAKLDLRSPLASTDLINNILGIQEVLLWHKDYQSRLSSYYSDSDDLWQNFSYVSPLPSVPAYTDDAMSDTTQQNLSYESARPC